MQWLAIANRNRGVMAKMERSAAHSVKGNFCVACGHWGTADEPAFRELVRHEFPARRCYHKARLYTFPDDRCEDWSDALAGFSAQPLSSTHQRELAQRGSE